MPVNGHRYQASGAPTGAPVLSIYQTDVVVYGGNLLDYLRRELVHDTDAPSLQNDPHRSNPWLELALNNEPTQHE